MICYEIWHDNPQLHWYQLEAASTHKSAKTHAGNIFVTGGFWDIVQKNNHWQTSDSENPTIVTAISMYTVSSGHLPCKNVVDFIWNVDLHSTCKS